MTDLRRTLWDWIGVAAFLSVLTLISWRSYSWWRPVDQPTDPDRNGMADFLDVVYYPARAALAGVNPYDSIRHEDGTGYLARYPAGNNFPVYSPLIFVFSLPFALLPVFFAKVLFWLTNVGLLLALAYATLRLCGLSASVGQVAGLAAALLLSRPGQANLHFGQLAIPMTLATLGAWHFAQRRPWWSSALLAVALIKPTFGGPLLVLMLLRGYYRPALYGVVSAAVLNAIVLGVLLKPDLTDPKLWNMLASNQTVTENGPAVDPQQTGSRIDFPLVVERLLGKRSAPFTHLILPLAILGISGWHVRSLARVPQGNQRRFAQPPAEPIDHGELLALALACITIAICIYHNIYDGLLLTVPAVAAWRAVAVRKYPWRWAIPLAVGLSMPAVNYGSSKQFAALMAQLLPAAFVGQWSSNAALWTFLCILNGSCLALAWLMTLVIVRNQASFLPAAQPSGSTPGTPGRS